MSHYATASVKLTEKVSTKFPIPKKTSSVT